MNEVARALADAVEAALPGWVARCVARRAPGGDVRPLEGAAAEAGRRAVAEVGPKLRALLEADIDQQWSTPLSLLRDAVVYPTEVLRAAGVPPVERDRFAEERFPDDVYDLTPASFADVDPVLVEPGVAWGAAKAFEHRRRHAS